jgi:hypothetical protein
LRLFVVLVGGWVLFFLKFGVVLLDQKLVCRGIYWVLVPLALLLKTVAVLVTL